MIDKCLVKVVSNKVICDIKKHEKNEKSRVSDIVKNKIKLSHLEGIGMNLDEYHPSIIKVMIDAGKSKVPEHIKNQLVTFAKEAHAKGFNPSIFGRNTTLHKFIKTVHNIPKQIRKQKVKGSGNVTNNSPTSSTEEETDIDGVLSDVEKDLKGGDIKKAKNNLKRYKHKIPKEFYNKIMDNI